MHDRDGARVASLGVLDERGSAVYRLDARSRNNSLERGAAMSGLRLIHQFEERLGLELRPVCCEVDAWCRSRRRQDSVHPTLATAATQREIQHSIWPEGAVSHVQGRSSAELLGGRPVTRPVSL